MNETSFFKFSAEVISETNEKFEVNNFESFEKNESDEIGDYVLRTFKFSSDDFVKNLVFNFKEYKDFIVGFYELEIKTEPFRKSLGIHKRPGIVLKLNLKDEPEKILANYMHRDWWTRPAFCNEVSEIPDRTTSLYIKSLNEYLYFPPICGLHSKTELKGAQTLNVQIIHNVTGVNISDDIFLAIGKGSDIYKLVEDSFRVVAKNNHSNQKFAFKKKYPEVFDYLGWCSWDAFYSEVNAKGLLEKNKEFDFKDIPVKWFLIDDGWLSVSDSALYSYEAEKEKFPEGLIEVTRKLKASGVNWIGVWHALGGYWGGIKSGSELEKVQNKYLHKTYKGKYLPHYEKDKSFGFFSDWYEYLKAEGIDFVKVDGQSALQNYYDNNIEIGEAAYGTHRGLEGAVNNYFDGNIINCMGMAPENIWNRPSSSLSRNSDDFVPNDRNGFKEHVLQNLYNALYHGQLYYTDWDMFWTNHYDSYNHAILRAISGGPVYISDKVGETNKKIIEPLHYLDGKILRCDRTGYPSLDCFFDDPDKSDYVQKITNMTNNKYGALAYFNIVDSKKILKAGPSDINDLKGDKFVVYNPVLKEAKVIGYSETIEKEVDKDEAGILNFIPYETFFVPVGLINKYVTTHSIKKITISDKIVIVTIYESGNFGFISEKEPKRILLENIDVINLLVKKDNLYVLDLPEKSEQTDLIFEF